MKPQMNADKNIKNKLKLSDIKIEVDDDGFTLWITETDLKGNTERHWIIDGSEVKKDGVIRLGDGKYIVFNIENNRIKGKIIDEHSHQ